MVRVLCCYHFTGQEVFNTSSEPLTVHATGNKLFLATAQCCIQVHDLDKTGCPCVAQIPTIALPIQIIHSIVGNYIGTIEEKPSRQLNSSVVSTRVYLNWKENCKSHQKKRIRFPGSVPHSCHSEEILDIIDFTNLSHDPVSISFCLGSGNLVIAGHKLVKVYQIVEKQLENGAKYKDVDPVIDIRFSFILKQVAICEEFLAVSSDTEIHVIKIQDRTLDPPETQEDVFIQSDEAKYLLKQIKSKTSSTSSDKENITTYSTDISGANSQLLSGTVVNTNNDTSSCLCMKCEEWTVVEDKDYLEWSCQENDTSQDVQGSSQPSRSEAKTINLESLSLKDKEWWEAKSIEILGPLNAEIPGHPLTIWCDGCVMQEGVVTTLLYKRFVLSKYEPLHSLQLIPCYKPDIKQCQEQSETSNGFLQSARRNALVGVCAFISTNREGYMYSVFHQTELLSIFPYTAHSTKIAVTNGMIYAVTETGLEIYTARGHVSAIHNIESFDNVTSSCPSVGLDTCLIGMQPFMVVEAMAVSERHLVLLSKVASSRGDKISSSIYALKYSSVPDLFNEMIHLGSQNRQSSPPTYVHLLQEAHLLLKEHLLFHDPEDSQTVKLYVESCALLGDYYASHETDDYTLALPYYLMTGLSTQDILQRLTQKAFAKENKTVSLLYGHGLIHYLDHVLLKSYYLVHLNQESCDTVNAVYAQTKPDSLAQIILQSTLNNCTVENAIILLKTAAMKNLQQGNENVRTENTFALAILHLNAIEIDTAKSILFSIKEDNLVALCVKYGHLLHVNQKEFTPLSLVIRRQDAQLFASILTSLCSRNVIGVDTVIRLLQGNQSALELYKNIHLQFFLENLIISGCVINVSEVTDLLYHMYMKRLKEFADSAPQRNTTMVPKPILQGRCQWLNQLPPFNGQIPSNKCIHLRDSIARVSSFPKMMSHPIHTKQGSVDDCSCWNCNQDLIKLQTLLCSKQATADVIKQIQSTVLTEDIRGALSLEILCTSIFSVADAVDIIVERHPQALPAFIRETIKSDHDLWCHAVESLVGMVKDDTVMSDHNRRQNYTEVFKGILTCMSESLSPEEMFTLLPPDANLTFVLPYMEKCCTKYLASKVKMKIMTDGQ